MRTIRVARETRYYDPAGMNLRGEAEKPRMLYSINPADAVGYTSGSPIQWIPLRAPYQPGNKGYLLPYTPPQSMWPLWVEDAYNGFPGYQMSNTKNIYLVRNPYDSTSGSMGCYFETYNQIFGMVFVPISGGTGTDYLLGDNLDSAENTYYNASTGEFNCYYDWTGLYVNWNKPNVLIQILHLGYGNFPTPDGRPTCHVLLNGVHTWDVDTGRGYIYFVNSIHKSGATTSPGFYLLEWFNIQRIPPRMYMSYARHLSERLMRKYG
jgi:hypothetical protein